MILSIRSYFYSDNKSNKIDSVLNSTQSVNKALIEVLQF